MIKSKNFKKFKGIKHGFFNKVGGKSKGIYQSLNCGPGSKDNKINIFEQLYDSDYFNLLLVHQPSIWNSLKEKANLTLSGHTHNGQIFPFNLIVKIQFPQIYGVYNHLKNYLYVSSGAATWGPKIRIGSKNEILNIELSNNL